MNQKKSVNDDNDMAQARQTLYEVLIGIVLLMVAECLVGFIISHDLRAYVSGAVLGSVGAAFFYFHLFFSLDKALDKAEKEAIKYSKIQTVIRLVVMGAVIVVSFTFQEYISVIMTFVGMMNVKFAAYLQPFTNKLSNKIKGR